MVKCRHIQIYNGLFYVVKKYTKDVHQHKKGTLSGSLEMTTRRGTGSCVQKPLLPSKTITYSIYKWKGVKGLAERNVYEGLLLVGTLPKRAPEIMMTLVVLNWSLRVINSRSPSADSFFFSITAERERRKCYVSKYKGEKKSCLLSICVRSTSDVCPHMS